MNLPGSYIEDRMHSACVRTVDKAVVNQLKIHVNTLQDMMDIENLLERGDIAFSDTEVVQQEDESFEPTDILCPTVKK